MFGSDASALHDALKSLGPTDTQNLPNDSELKPYLEEAFRTATLLVDTVPEPASKDTPTAGATGRARSNTATSVTSSSARSEPPSSERAVLQKEWKEVKPGGANPHRVQVYKLSGKDGNGAWFARRSVHEGIGFRQFRKSLRREFEEGLKFREEEEAKNAQSGETGPANVFDSGTIMLKKGVRGIGCERRIEHKVVKGLGRLDVYQLAAQFPGPSAPRDFVTLCLTTAATHPSTSTTSTNSKTNQTPREFTMISRPFKHDKLPPLDGYVRGQYESVEFIREIVTPSESDSTESSSGRPRSQTVGGQPLLKTTMRGQYTGFQGRQRGQSIGDSSSGQSRGKSPLANAISSSDLQDPSQNGTTDIDNDDDNDDNDHEYDERESNPVEWIMLTRSDPGGSVPRFLVERGTPGSIVTDAGKFLDWALGKEHHDHASDDEEEPGKNLDGSMDEEDDDLSDDDDAASVSSFQTAPSPELSDDESLANGNVKTKEKAQALNTAPLIPASPSTAAQSSVSVGAMPRMHQRSASSLTLQNIQDEQSRLSERLAKQRLQDAERQTKELDKETEKERKLQEKHEREEAKRQEKFRREQEKAARKKAREEEKIAERKRKLEEKDERLRWDREREQLKSENALLRKERDALAKELNLAHTEIEQARNEFEAFKSTTTTGTISAVPIGPLEAPVIPMQNDHDVATVLPAHAVFPAHAESTASMPILNTKDNKTPSIRSGRSGTEASTTSGEDKPSGFKRVLQKVVPGLVHDHETESTTSLPSSLPETQQPVTST